MNLTTQEVLDVVKKFGKTEKDTGAPEVQVAILTARITKLAPHFDKHKKDFHSQRGLMQMVGQRKSLLRYLSMKNPERYQFVLKELGLRK